MSPPSHDLPALRRLRLMALIEGATLVCLIFVAVPLKHLLGISIGVRLMGPIHGVAFIAYAWAVMAAVSGGGWMPREIARLAVGALIPFASFINERWLMGKERAMKAGSY